MRNWSVLSGIMGWTAIALAFAGAAQSAKPVAPNDDPFRRGGSYLEAAVHVLHCAKDAKPRKAFELCNTEWRGIKLLLYSNWNAQLDLPSGVRWLVSCEYDAIERDDTCIFDTGDGFAIVMSDGYQLYVNWGHNRFPGSEISGRFDDDAPISSASPWSLAQSRSIIKRMRTARVLRYRWYDWPDQMPHDGRIDLKGFSDVSALMVAIRDEFTTARVSGKTNEPE